MIYKDDNGIEYSIGDIVFNPCMGDFWVVQECNKQEKEFYGIETDICLALYNNKDDYVVDIDEPVGFTIAIRPGDDDYEGALAEINHIAEVRKKYEQELDKENKFGINE